MIAPRRCVSPELYSGHQAEVGFELMRVAEALGIIDGGEEGGGGDGADAGDGAQPQHARILDGEVFERGVGVRELRVDETHEGEQWRDDRAQAAVPDPHGLDAVTGHARS